MTALVGPSGAGKTTLSGLVPRLYDVVSGSLPIDGHDVRDVTLASVSGCGGRGDAGRPPFPRHASPPTSATPGPKRPTPKLVAACQAARIHDLIVSLPDGYDTVVGERGYRLSGGEKQRLAIARVLLKDPAVVILDEATAHLDSETELLVQQALAAALPGRTSIVIAHRLSTIQAADQILVLDDGQIVARGTHASLIARGRPVRRPVPDPVPAGTATGGGRRQLSRPRRRSRVRVAVRVVALGGLQPAAQAGGVGMDAVEGLQLAPVLRVDACRARRRTPSSRAAAMSSPGPPGPLGHLGPAAQDPLGLLERVQGLGEQAVVGQGHPGRVCGPGTCAAT